MYPQEPQTSTTVGEAPLTPHTDHGMHMPGTPEDTLKPTHLALDHRAGTLAISFEDGAQLTLAPGGTLAEPVGICWAELRAQNGGHVRYQGASQPPKDDDCRITQFGGGLGPDALARHWRAAIADASERQRNPKPEDAALIRILLEPASLVYLRHIELGRCGPRI
jgi:hypothetical protein